MTVFTKYVLNTITLVVLTIVGIGIYNLRKKYTYWKVRNVPYVTGIFNDYIFRHHEVSSIWYEKVYNTFSHQRYVGFYLLGKPALLIRDPKLIQLILLKDASHFMGKFGEIDENLDPLLCSLVHLAGDRWKNLRAKFAELFSSGKLKAMYSLLEKCAMKLDSQLEEALTKSGEIEMYTVFSKFAIDVVGVCAYGLDFKAIQENNARFKRIACKEFTTAFKETVKSALNAVSPNIASWLKIRTVDPKVENFIFCLTRHMMENRKKDGRKRKDFMQLLINLHQKEQTLVKSGVQRSESVLTENAIAAAVLAFLVGGTNNAALPLTFCMYQLARNPDVMEKLYQEITRVKNIHNGTLDYSALQEMRYLDSVKKETMRINSSSKELTRMCTKPYKIPDSSVIIEKNTVIKVSLSSLALDPQFFPEPEKFDPDRFNEENRHNIIAGTYYPFGEGRRNCIASRFAMLELKVAVAQIVGKYTVDTTERTETASMIKPNASFTAPLHEIYLRFRKREE